MKKIVGIGMLFVGALSSFEYGYAMERKAPANAPDAVGSTTKVVVYCGKEWSNSAAFNQATILPVVEQYVDEMLQQGRKKLKKLGRSEIIARPHIICHESSLKSVENPGEVALEATTMLQLVESSQRAGVTDLHIATAGEGGAIWAMVSQLLADIAGSDSGDEGAMGGSTRGAAVHLVEEGDQTKKIAGGMSRDATGCHIRVGLNTTDSYTIAVLDYASIGAFSPVGFGLSLGAPRRVSKTDSLIGAWYTNSFETATLGGARSERLSAAELAKIKIYIHLFGPSYVTRESHKATFNLGAVQVKQYVSLHDLSEVKMGFEPKVDQKCCCCAWWDRQTPEDKAFVKSCACSVAKVAIMVVVAFLTGGALSIQL